MDIAGRVEVLVRGRLPAEAVRRAGVHHVPQAGEALGFRRRSHDAGADQPAAGVACRLVRQPLREDGAEAVADALIEGARLAVVDQPAFVLGHAVREFVADDVGRPPEVDEDLVVAVAVDHLLTVPEGVLVILVVVQARHQVHALVVDRVASQHGLVELRHLRRRIEYGLEGLIGRRIRDDAAGQGGAVFAIEQMLDRLLGDGRGPQPKPALMAGQRRQAMALAHQAQPLRHGVGALIGGAVGAFDFLALRQLTQDVERDDEAATAFWCVEVCHVRLRCRMETGHSAVIFPFRAKNAGRVMAGSVFQKYNPVQRLESPIHRRRRGA